MISLRSPVGRIYVIAMVLTCATGFFIFHHGGFGKPHVLGIVTLAVTVSRGNLPRHCTAVSSSTTVARGGRLRSVELGSLSPVDRAPLEAANSDQLVQDERYDCLLKGSGYRQNALLTTPPSTRRAAPVVADASGLAT